MCKKRDLRNCETELLGVYFVVKKTLEIDPVKELGHFKWLGRVWLRDKNKLVKWIFEAREIGKEKRKTKKDVDGRPEESMTEISWYLILFVILVMSLLKFTQDLNFAPVKSCQM